MTIDRLVVQVGGGALASACFEALADARALGALEALPRIDTVQTGGAWPLRRAFDEVAERRRAARRPSAYAAHAIARSSCGRGRASRGASRTASSTTRPTTGWPSWRRCSPPAAAARRRRGRRWRDAHALAHEATAIDVDPTGSAGLAGLLALRASGEVGRRRARRRPVHGRDPCEPIAWKERR